MSNAVTLLELVNTVASYATTEAVLLATVARLVNSGAVKLCGNFRGARFDVDALVA